MLNEEKFISDLYLNRKALVIPFKENVISVCEDLNYSYGMNTFFLKGKGGIYMFSYKTYPDIYYIGKAKYFHKRLKAHLNTDLKNRFHVFANVMKWDKILFFNPWDMWIRYASIKRKLLFTKIFTFIKYNIYK